MKHFLSISDITYNDVQNLLHMAMALKFNKILYPILKEHALVNLFYENSTRTRMSFELAAKRLSIPVMNFNCATSSEAKGEIILDTVKNLAAMGINLMAIRHQENGLPQKLAAECDILNLHIINAGDGQHAHPSQALLDLMTILEYKTNLKQLKVVLIGDLRHSRVANSLQCLFKLVNVGELYLVSPESWRPRVIHYGIWMESLDDGLQDVDVIITLRVQKERFNKNEELNLVDYCNNYSVTPKKLKLARNDAIVMHPGPLNRGVEITDAVADGSQSVILQQVQNGVYMRMAIIHALLKSQ